MNYSKHWDLSTIPSEEFASEAGRRSRAKVRGVPNVKLEPCVWCSKDITARERRKACPYCGLRQRKGSDENLVQD